MEGSARAAMLDIMAQEIGNGPRLFQYRRGGLMPSAPDTAVRAPAVAGMFYPASPMKLEAEIDEMLARVPAAGGPAPKALIVPHAGYIYSGPIAASAYARLKPARGKVSRVILLGP